MREPQQIGNTLEGLFETCNHNTTVVRYKTFSNGTQHLCTQCLVCGQRVGRDWLSQAGVDMSTILPFDEKLAEDRQREDSQRRQTTLQAERLHRHQEYERYLQESEDWDEVRRKVMQRDGCVCQACLEEAASQVHHRSYTHLFDEVMYDLVSVCKRCHMKIHGKL